mgnify:CR=1 FL=1
MSCAECVLERSLHDVLHATRTIAKRQCSKWIEWQYIPHSTMKTATTTTAFAIIIIIIIPTSVKQQRPRPRLDGGQRCTRLMCADSSSAALGAKRRAAAWVWLQPHYCSHGEVINRVRWPRLSPLLLLFITLTIMATCPGIKAATLFLDTLVLILVPLTLASLLPRPSQPHFTVPRLQRVQPRAPACSTVATWPNTCSELFVWRPRTRACSLQTALCTSCSCFA